MSDHDDPPKQLESTRGGSGGKGKTAVGAGDFKPLGGERRNAVICDKNPLIRQGWRAMLAPFVDIVGETNSAKDAIEIARAVKPDVLLLDVDLEEGTGYDVCKLLSQAFNTVIATDSYSAITFFNRLQRAGVVAIILKSSGPGALFDAIRFGIRQTPYIDPKISPLLHQHPKIASSAQLTDREVEVLIRLTALNKDVAEELDMQVRTVEKHIECIQGKLRVPTRTAAALKAAQLGYILLPPMPDRDPITGKTSEELAAERHAREAIDQSSA